MHVLAYTLAQAAADTFAFIIALPMAAKVYREFASTGFGAKITGCEGHSGA